MSLDTNAAGIQVNAIVTPQAPMALTAVVTTANSNYTDTPTNSVEFLPASGAAISAAAPRGMRITSLKALARATPTATELQLFVSDSAAATKRFIRSRLMAAYTVAQTTAQAEVDFGYTDSAPLILAAGERLWFATGVSNTGIVGRAEGGAY
jgi:hypothetical protein